MPTKYQAQVMMTSKAKPSHVRREGASWGPIASNDGVTARLKATLQPVKSPRDSSSAAAHEEWWHPPTSVSRARIRLSGAAKRIFDFLVGLALLIVATPIILIAAL